jgi:hypothetical protein
MADDGDEPRSQGEPDKPAEDAPDEAVHPPEDEVSWLGCLWLVVVPLIVLGATVVTLNWLGC